MDELEAVGPYGHLMFEYFKLLPTFPMRATSSHYYVGCKMSYVDCNFPLGRKKKQ